MEEIREFLVAKLAELCGKDAAEISDETNPIADFDMKSGTMVVLIAALEEELDADIDFMDFRAQKTVGAMVEFLDELVNC